jgi:hypothetical protein|tara:strand:+ start:297 stop:821 length:525 start_codon:yes stop_codon:yes gene_type:complete
MDFISIAQFLSGIATLIVASILVWQITLQKQALDIAHQDADRNVSMQSFAMIANHHHLTLDGDFSEIYAKRNRGYENLNDVEKDKFNSFYRISYGINMTEWRLGRLKNNPGYYSNFYNGVMDSETGIEFYRLRGRNLISRANFGDKSLLEIADKVYEEKTSEKNDVEKGKLNSF